MMIESQIYVVFALASTILPHTGGISVISGTCKLCWEKYETQARFSYMSIELNFLFRRPFLKVEIMLQLKWFCLILEFFLWHGTWAFVSLPVARIPGRSPPITRGLFHILYLIKIPFLTNFQNNVFWHNFKSTRKVATTIQIALLFPSTRRPSVRSLRSTPPHITHTCDHKSLFYPFNNLIILKNYIKLNKIHITSR